MEINKPMKYNKSITATVYVINDGKVLLHQHKKYKTWFTLGGHIEENEFPHEAAIREVKEESGFDVKLIDTEIAPSIELARVKRVPSPFCLLHEGTRKIPSFKGNDRLSQFEAFEFLRIRS